MNNVQESKHENTRTLTFRNRRFHYEEHSLMSSLILLPRFQYMFKRLKKIQKISNYQKIHF